MTGPDRLLQLLRRLIGRAPRWRGLQSYLCDQLQVPLRTLQRWTAQLRDEGKVVTHQSIDLRGYRNQNVYELVDHGGPSKGYLVGGSSSSSTTASNSSKSNPYGSTSPLCDAPRSGIKTSGRPSQSKPCGKSDIQMRKIKPVTGQAGLFPDDQLDGRPTPSDNGPVRQVATRATKGSPASRSVTYWLAGRHGRPPGYVIAGVGRAIRKCFELNPDLTEREMRDAIDSLMQRGLDCSPRHYSAAFGVRPKVPPKPRDYTAQPTWKHHPRPSSMTEERKTVLRGSRLIPESRPLSDTLLGVSPFPAIPTTVATTATLPNRSPASPLDDHGPVGFKIERIAEALPTNAAEMARHVEFQRTQSLDHRPSVSTKTGVGSALAWLRDGRNGGRPLDDRTDTV